MNKYTSLELSKKLQENWFEWEYNKVYVDWYYTEWIIYQSHDWIIMLDYDKYLWIKAPEERYSQHGKQYYIWNLIDDDEYIPAYDILNDLCVKYAKEMFGEEIKDFSVWNFARGKRECYKY